MNLRRGLTPFLRGFFELYYGDLRCKSTSLCEFERYGFSETCNSSIRFSCQKICFFPYCLYLFLIPSVSLDVPEFSSPFGEHTNDLIKFATKKVCPAVVYVSHEKGIGGSGIIIDSDGTILTRACTRFSMDSRSKINVSLHDGREFSGTILESNEDHHLTLLKIQSESPLPTTTLDYSKDYKGREFISFERLLRRTTYPRLSSQNELDNEIIISPHDGREFSETFLEPNEGNLMLSNEELMSKIDIDNFHLGRCGGPIVSLDGDVVGISTQINILWPCANGNYCGTISTMEIEEALCEVGYRTK